MPRNNEPGMRKDTPRVAGSGKWSKYRQSGRAGHDFKWSGVDSSVTMDAIVAVTKGGAAIMFGTTRDGGCGVVTVCDGDDRLKLYGTTVEQMEQELSSLFEWSNTEELQ